MRRLVFTFGVGCLLVAAPGGAWASCRRPAVSGEAEAKAREVQERALREAAHRDVVEMDRLLRECLVTDPNNAECHRLRATRLAEKGDATGAVRELRCTLELDPDSPAARQIRQMLSRWDAATRSRSSGAGAHRSRP